MQLRIGLDLVSIASVEESLAEHGENYLKRVFTDREIADCGGAENLAIDRLAARFAAKEAAIKVLAGADDATPWRDIEIIHGDRGEPVVNLTGICAELARRAGLSVFSLSITHEGDYAAAAVVASQDLRSASANRII